MRFSLEQRLSALVSGAIVLFIVFCANASAQTVNSTVTGVVRDAAGAVIPGAKVTLTDAATKLSVNTTTNGEGFYLFNDVRSGYYSVAVEATSFKKSEVRDVKVDVGVPATVNVNLETGQIAEVITTTASDSQAVVNTENAQLTATIFEKQINDLPLNGRNPVQLASMQAGVASVSDDGTRASTINGMRGSFNNITWDGINIQENYLRGAANSGIFAQAGPSVVAVAEFTIVTQNAGAADGTGAAQVKLVTPRGSTEFHGQVFEFHRNDAIDANTFFNNAADLDKEKLIQNQFGFGIGGPIKLPRKVFGPLGFDTNKLFFYAYDEETRVAETTGLTRTTLHQAARQGNFTYRRVDNGQLETRNLLSLTGRLIDPTIQSQLALTPTPNDPTAAAGDRINTGAFRFNSPSGSTERLWGFRIDYNHSERHRFEAIHSNNASDLPNDTFNNTGEPFPGLPGVGQFPRRKRWSFAWNWAPTSTINNEVRGGTYRQTSRFLNSTEFPEGYVLTWPIIGGGTTAAAAVTNPVRTNQDNGRDGNITDISDNASWAKGDHFLRFGGGFRHVQIIPFSFAGNLPGYTIGFGPGNVNPLNSGNQAQFPGGIASNDFTNASNLLALLTGTLRQSTQTFNVVDANSGYVTGAPQRRDLRYYALGFYVGDTWRFRPNLTLNIGLRHDYYDPVREVNGIGLLPRGGLEALSDPNLVLELAGGGKGTRPFYKPDKNNFAPSFSFSWDPFKDGKTAIRGGYSISYVLDSPTQTAENAAIDGNDGLSSVVTVPNIDGVVSGNRPPVTSPDFKIPRTLKDQQVINQNPTVFSIDPNLKTPYVQQWNIGIEREIFRDTAIEVRYVGNRGVKLTRGIDINQVVIFGNGFLDDFKRAQGNLFASEAENARQTAAGVPSAGRVVISPDFNQAVPGSQRLTIFPQVGRRGFYTNATGSTLDSAIVNLIRQGQVGEVAQTYIGSRNTYLTPGTNRAVLSPGFFLRANPEAGAVDLIGNGSFSNYNALQAEIRRRLKNGVYFQANYTWSKGFTDYDGGSNNFSALLDLEQGVALEKKRITNDITHVFRSNGIYELPFGPGKPWLQSGLASRLFGGWQFSGIFEARTGRPISFTSNRGTVNRQSGTRSARNTVITSLSRDELQDRTGLFFDPATGRPLFVDPSLIGPDGRGNPQSLQNPEAGQYGTLQLTPVSGPAFWNVDLSLIKRTKIKESWNLEFRAEVFNAFNHTNFYVGAENNDINSTTFGRLTETLDPRILQFALKLNF
jgi:carboxypeptidase family protein/TonB-dependent receptor-like protein